MEIQYDSRNQNELSFHTDKNVYPAAAQQQTERWLASRSEYLKASVVTH
jgi:hypothetical protein